jgi:transaldolase
MLLSSTARSTYVGLFASVRNNLLRKHQGTDIDSQVDAALDRLLVEFGSEILKIVPGKVSTEVDARFSFDKKASVDKALHIIDVSDELGSSFSVR